MLTKCSEDEFAIVGWWQIQKPQLSPVCLSSQRRGLKKRVFDTGTPSDTGPAGQWTDRLSRPSALATATDRTETSLVGWEIIVS
jgi:hypothetical protein